MTDDLYDSRMRCAPYPAGVRIGARDEDGLLPVGTASAALGPRFERKFTIGSGDVELAAHLMIPGGAAGVVIVVDGGESGRRHSCTRLAVSLNQAGLGTLVAGLLMPQEALVYGNLFNVRALAGRLTGVTRWLLRHPAVRGLPVGYFGAGAAAAAALWAAAAEPRVPVAAIACQDGRPDLAWPQLGHVRPPTLLIVGSADEVVLGLNRQARQQLSCESELAVIPGAARLPGEPGDPEQVARLAAGWFTRHFISAAGAARLAQAVSSSAC